MYCRAMFFWYSFVYLLYLSDVQNYHICENCLNLKTCGGNLSNKNAERVFKTKKEEYGKWCIVRNPTLQPLRMVHSETPYSTICNLDVIMNTILDYITYGQSAELMPVNILWIIDINNLQPLFCDQTDHIL